MVDWNRIDNNEEGEDPKQTREDAKAKGEICVGTSTLPPSMVSKVQEAGSFDIAFR